MPQAKINNRGTVKSKPIYQKQVIQSKPTFKKYNIEYLQNLDGDKSFLYEKH